MFQAEGKTQDKVIMLEVVCSIWAPGGKPVQLVCRKGGERCAWWNWRGIQQPDFSGPFILK